MNNTEHMMYWLWLTTKQAVSPEKITILLEYFDTVEDIYFTKSFDKLSFIDARTREALADKDLRLAQLAAERSERINSRIIAFDSDKYPSMLRNIPVPPYILYIQGSMPDFDNILTIGVVGTRAASDYGRVVTERMCADLAHAGVITVNGLARGIDSVGAWATLDAGGTSAAIVGSGLDIVYPPENAELVQAITEKGCIISEYPPGSSAIPSHFPARNRIIAGISQGTLVTEAPRKSGALITARYALDNCRDVFAVPRAVTDTKFLGTNDLIQQGAKLVNSAEDIICEYPYAKILKNSDLQNEAKAHRPLKTRQAPKTVTIDNDKYNKLNVKEKAIIDTIKKKDIQVDELSRTLNIPAGELNTMLFMLEVGGLVKKLPGGFYQLKI